MYRILKKIVRHAFFPLLFLALVAGGSLLFQSQPTAQQPAAPAAPAPAAAPAAPPPPAGDPSGANADGPLYAPNSYLSGWGTGSMDKDGNWKPYADPKAPTPQELSKNLSHAFYSINFVWTLLCGFLVMFM